jgi:hypothetical protein
MLEAEIALDDILTLAPTDISVPNNQEFLIPNQRPGLFVLLLQVKTTDWLLQIRVESEKERNRVLRFLVVS